MGQFPTRRTVWAEHFSNQAENNDLINNFL